MSEANQCETCRWFPVQYAGYWCLHPDVATNDKGEIKAKDTTRLPQWCPARKHGATEEQPEQMGPDPKT